MKIRLIMIALQLAHLPTDGTDMLELDDGASLSDAMNKLELSQDNSYLTLVNDLSVPASTREQTRLKDGDTVTLFSPIKGG